MKLNCGERSRKDLAVETSQVKTSGLLKVSSLCSCLSEEWTKCTLSTNTDEQFLSLKFRHQMLATLTDSVLTPERIKRQQWKAHVISPSLEFNGKRLDIKQSECFVSRSALTICKFNPIFFHLRCFLRASHLAQATYLGETSPTEQPPKDT